MEATVERKSAVKPRARKLTTAEKELKAMQACMNKVTSSKKASLAFMKRTGIIDEKGELAPQYRS